MAARHTVLVGLAPMLVIVPSLFLTLTIPPLGFVLLPIAFVVTVWWGVRCVPRTQALSAGVWGVALGIPLLLLVGIYVVVPTVIVAMGLVGRYLL